MKRAIPCSIETITVPGEDAWIITIAATDVPDAIIYLTSLHYGKITHLKLTDGTKTAIMEPHHLLLDGLSIDITPDWREAILAMLLDIQLNGWSHPAHLDQDFPAPGGAICICFAVAPPTII